jgi:hypothetical protein
LQFAYGHWIVSGRPYHGKIFSYRNNGLSVIERLAGNFQESHFSILNFHASVGFSLLIKAPQFGPRMEGRMDDKRAVHKGSCHSGRLSNLRRESLESRRFTVRLYAKCWTERSVGTGPRPVSKGCLHTRKDPRGLAIVGPQHREKSAFRIGRDHAAGYLKRSGKRTERDETGKAHKMILGWSPHQTGTAHGEPIRYLMSPEIEKQIDGRTVVVKRRPVPELLLGEPELFLKALRRLPLKNRYRVATMTFNTDEICPDRFNQGEPFLRAAVASCIEAFLEFSFAGLPTENRLPFVVGTHSHTARLEINFALPRGIFNPHGRVLSFNPHPPMRGSRDDFDHLTDMLNHNFGWTDPRDPDRMRRLKTAGWIEKRAAEALRNGVTPCPLEDPITHLWVNLRALAYDMEHPSDLVSALSRELPEVGMKIDNITAKSITIAGQSGKQRMCLRGSLVDGIGPCSLYDVQKRAEYLAEAHDRVAVSWAKRAAWNSERYSKSRWAVPTPDFRALLTRPTIAIPQQHPAKLVLSGRMTPTLTGVFRILIERLSRLKSDILTRLGQVEIITSLSKSLLQPLRTLNTELEKINAEYARTQGSPY